MDNEKPRAEPDEKAVSAGRSMPKSTPFSANLPPTDGLEAKPDEKALSSVGLVSAQDAEPKDRNGVFANLVRNDSDIAGLVAYSIYKQHKLDWLTAFEKVRGRAPNDAELASYIVGEATPRRLATYRHLAEATLAGNGPDVSGVAGAGKDMRSIYRGGGSAEKTALTTGLLATYAVIAVLFLIGFLLAARYTMSAR